MNALPKVIEDEYPDNRLAVVILPDSTQVECLIYMSARYGVFKLARGIWVECSEDDYRSFAQHRYFHVSMERFHELVEMFSYENPDYPIVELDDLREFEIVYQFEEPFWGYETSDDEPYQLRSFAEIKDFADGFPKLYEVFNPADKFARASEWAAHMQRDKIAVSWIQAYQLRIRKIRQEFITTPNQKMYWVDHLPQLNSFALQLYNLTNSIYEDLVDVSPEWAEVEYEPGYLERETIVRYLFGQEPISTSELMDQCNFMTKVYLKKMSVPALPQIQNADKNVANSDESFYLNKYYRSSTPFGPGAFSFVILRGDIVQELVLETDFGVFFLNKSEPDAPEFPIWTFWDLAKRDSNLSGKEFVYIPKRNMAGAINLWQTVRDDDLIDLRKEHLLPLWQDPEPDESSQSRDLWQSSALYYSQLPWDAKFIIDWAVEYVSIFGQKIDNDTNESRADLLFRFTSGQIALTKSEVISMVADNTVWQF